MPYSLKQTKSSLSHFLVADDVLKELEKARLRFTSSGDEHNLLLLLKMFSYLLNYREDALVPYHHCLKQLSQKLHCIPNQGREVFYVEVKRLVNLLKTRNQLNDSTQDVEMESSDPDQDYIELKNSKVREDRIALSWL